jgi:hypothetical protein
MDRICPKYNEETEHFECHHKQKAAEMKEKFFELNPAEEQTRFQKIYIYSNKVTCICP